MDASAAALLLLVSLIGCAAQQDILPEGPLDAIVGRNVTIRTKVKDTKLNYVIWNFNDGTDQVHIATLSPSGLKVNELYAGRASINGSNGFLTLRALTPEDSGEYNANIITGTDDTYTGEIELRVFEPVSDVVIKSNMPSAIEHNSTVVLTCSAKGSYLEFKWTNGSADIVDDGKRITIKKEELSSTLTIAGVLRSDLLGPIVCTAANKLETDKSDPFNLTVHYGPDWISITPPNPPQFIRSGSNFSLSCSALSSPPAKFSWYHGNDQLISEGPVLTLKAIEQLKLGPSPAKFTCRAQNPKTERVIPSFIISLAAMDAIPDVTVSGPTAVLIAGNSSANLSCPATGAALQTTWLKDGATLTAGGRLVFAEDKSSVRIDPLLKEDNGEYTCQLENPVDKKQASYKLVVNYGPEEATVSGASAIEVTEGTTLTCAAASVPAATFTWKFNGTLTAVKTAEYVIKDATYRNSGTYTCEAHNNVTGQTTGSTHSLSVKEEGALDEGLSDGAIAGIVIAVLIALGAAIALIMYCRQKVPVESPY